jgi:hypothetical protein
VATVYALIAAAMFLFFGEKATREASSEHLLLAFCCISTAAAIWIFEHERLTFAKRRDNLFELIDHATDPVGMLLDDEIVYQNRMFVELTGKDSSQRAVTPQDVYPPWAVTLLQTTAMPSAIAQGS